MPLKNNPACNCCAEATSCCETIVVKPLPTRTDTGGVITYDDTLWDSDYVTGISGTDNTIPANTTVTIQVPVCCTDYAVDVEMLDDGGASVTADDGLRIKVADSLQVSCETPAAAMNYYAGFYNVATSATDTVQHPTLMASDDVYHFQRDSVSLYSITRPFYGDYYAAYRFFEINSNGRMNAAVQSYRAPPWRSDVSTDAVYQVVHPRFPYDAGGLTIQITIETGSQSVEVGLIQVHTGHRSCSTITGLDSLPSDIPSDCDANYVIRDPSSLITNNGSLTATYFKDGTPLKSISSCPPINCTYEINSTFRLPQWAGGNYSWIVKVDPYDLSDWGVEVNASVQQSSDLDTYLQKVATNAWTHGDRLIDHRRYLWEEPKLSNDYEYEYSITINGNCDITAYDQNWVDNFNEPYYQTALYPSFGPNVPVDATQCGNSCSLDLYYCGTPHQYASWVWLYYVANPSPRQIGVIAPEGTVESFWSLDAAFEYPSAGKTANASKGYSFGYSDYSYTKVAGCCSWDNNTGTMNIDIDVTELATIQKITRHNYYDEGYTYELPLIGHRGFQNNSIRDYQLQELELYVADEDDTFTAESGLIMNYTAVNLSSTRPDYETCGCPCTASELYSDDLTGYQPSGDPDVCIRYHRMMEFSNGSETWYVRFYDSSGTWLFRRKSDCKEILFTGVNTDWPDATLCYSLRTDTNTDGDTLSVKLYG